MTIITWFAMTIFTKPCGWTNQGSREIMAAASRPDHRATAHNSDRNAKMRSLCPGKSSWPKSGYSTNSFWDLILL